MTFAGMAVPVLGEARMRGLKAQCWGLANVTDAGDLARAAA